MMNQDDIDELDKDLYESGATPEERAEVLFGIMNGDEYERANHGT